MGGSESKQPSYVTPGVNDQPAPSNATVDRAALEAWGRAGGRADRLNGSLYQKNGRYYNDPEYKVDVTDYMTAFSEWQAAQQRPPTAYSEYLRLSKEQPGRSATILVPHSAPQQKTLLGAVNNAPKTLLGG